MVMEGGGGRKVTFAKGVKGDEEVDGAEFGGFSAAAVAAAEEEDEFDWEAGEVEFHGVADGDGGFKEDGVEKAWNGEVTIEQDGSISIGKSSGSGRPEKATPRRRATARDKEFAELIHKAHLLCLVGRGRLVDAACNDSLLQASIISVLPASLGLSGDSELTPNMKVLGRLVSWFMKFFRIFADGEGSSSSSSFSELEKEDQAISRRIMQAVEKQAGSAEEIAAITVALFRGLGFTTRYVTIMNAAPLKPDADSLEASQEWAAASPSGSDEQHQQHQQLFSTHYDMETNKVASLARILARTASQQVNGGRTSNLSPVPVEGGGRGSGASPSAAGGGEGAQGRGRGKGRRGGRGGHGKAAPVVTTAAAAVASGTDGVQGEDGDGSGINASTVARRKGDEEYEMQLAMAIAATAAAADCQSTVSAAGEEKPTTAVENSSPVAPAAVKSARGIKGLGVSGKARLAQKLGGGGSAGAVWSRKVVPAMHWAEVYCNEGPAGRWVHVDAAKGIVDGADKVEGAAAVSRLPLRYAVAFAGGGAKDVTRRYVTLWASVASLRVDTAWWDETLRPLRDLEAAATAGSDQKMTATTSAGEQPRGSLDEADPMKRGTKRPNGTLSSTDEASLADGIPTTQAAAEAAEHGVLPGSNAPHSDGHLDLSGAARGRARPRTRNSSKLSTGVGDRGALEDMEMETKTFTEPLPTNQQAYKSHHLYVLEKWLNKYEALYPKGPVLGYCAGQPIYPRTSVQTLHTPDRWLREGFKVNPGEPPAKVVKGSRFKGEKIDTSAVEGAAPEQQQQQDEKGGDVPSSPGTALYGKWQTQAWQPPRAVNGKVPKNERGQVDAWSEKCIPPGTVHLRLPRLVPIVEKLGFDFAPAMVGFEIRKGRAFPAYDGIVVCEEFQDVILDAYNFQEDARYGELLKKKEEHASKRWFQLLHSLSTRQRLQAAYEVPLPSPTAIGTRSRSSGGSPLGREGNLGRGGRSKGAPAPESPRQKSASLSGIVEKEVATQKAAAAGGAKKHGQILESQHVHEFPQENQSYDEDSGVRTKTCLCGFTYYVEEM